jgi:hypothetical protein
MDMFSFSKPLKTLVLILVVKSFIAALLILYAGIGLAPDEAQYWTWSQDLSLGYYSKPPGVAWQIYLGTKLFGDTELGIRFMSVIISACIALATYFLARKCSFSSEKASWAGIVIALSPIGILSSLAATTDGGFILFWILASAYLVGALREERTLPAVKIGCMIACGALFKWTIYAFIPLVIVFDVCYMHSSKRSFVKLCLVSLLGMIPSFIWNATHEWATFKHVLWTNILGTATKQGASSGNTLEFVAAQTGILSPLYFIILVMAVVYVVRNRKGVGRSVLFCFMACVLPLSIYVVLSLAMKMQVNWVVYAYPTGAVLLSWYALERLRNGKRWLIIGTGVSLLMSACVIAVPVIQKHAMEKVHIPYRISMFRHNVGWDTLQQKLDDIGYSSEEHFLFSNTYQMTSILSFYNATQTRAYFLNTGDTRKNQFSFWPSLYDEQQGKTGFFVVVENKRPKDEERRVRDTKALLAPYFSSIKYVGREPIFVDKNFPEKNAYIFKCFRYNGVQSKESLRY